MTTLPECQAACCGYPTALTALEALSESRVFKVQCQAVLLSSPVELGSLLWTALCTRFEKPTGTGTAMNSGLPAAASGTEERIGVDFADIYEQSSVFQ